VTNLREPSSYQPRLVDTRLAQLLREFPAIALSGPRAVGKTTTALRHANDIARLDVPAQAAAFRLDPDAALRGRGEPLVLDEWQEVPEVLGAVKRAVDDDHRPGRFILTGSVRAELTQATWPGTGRLVRVQMFGLTEREVRGNVGSDRPGFVDRLATADPDQLAGADRETSIPDYVELALRSGFPEIATSPLADEDRAAWLDGYLGQLLTRDAHALDPRRDVQRMRRYFEVLALNTAGTPSEASLFDAAGASTHARPPPTTTSSRTCSSRNASRPGPRIGFHACRSRRSDISWTPRSRRPRAGSPHPPCCAMATSSAAWSTPSHWHSYDPRLRSPALADALITCAPGEAARRSI